MDISPTALMGSLKSDLELAIGVDLATYEGQLSFTLAAEDNLVAAKHLLDAFLKKYRGSGKELKEADRAAFALFQQWNKRCEAWQAPVPTNEVDSTLLGEFKSCFMQCFERPGGELIDFSSEAPANFRVGPGASVGVLVTDLYTKVYAGDLSTTSDDLYWHYYASTLPFESQVAAEMKRSESFCAPVVRGSNLGFAPKNRAISRTRCTEPNLNMMYQLGTGKVLEDVLRQRFGIDLSTQPQCNNELSRLGSLHGHVGTTDMTSASDATSLNFWSWAMPYKQIHDWFMWIRSSETKHPFNKDEWVTLHMLSSMGNGYTFPLMTLIFLCAVEAVYRYLGIPMVKNKTVRNGRAIVPGNFGVFGDDIIVVTEAFDLVNHLLELLGYAVNREKSFGAGPFRESCGTDWFHGKNVRGVYCKTLATPQKRYALINHLNAWSANWNIQLPQTIRMLTRSVWYLPVPPWENADAGIIVPFDIFRVKQRTEHGGFVYHAYRPVRLAWEPAKGLTECHLCRAVKSYDEGGLLPAKEVEFPFINLDGLIQAAVRGTFRDGEISVRGNTEGARYKKSRLETPGWGFNGTSSVGFTRTGWARFEKTLASINLGKLLA